MATTTTTAAAANFSADCLNILRYCHHKSKAKRNLLSLVVIKMTATFQLTVREKGKKKKEQKNENANKEPRISVSPFSACPGGGGAVLLAKL